MYSRDLTNEKYVLIPGEDLSRFKKAVEETYEANFIQRGLDFELYGFLFPKEFVLNLCMFNPKDLNLSPTSFFCSVELKDEKPSDKILTTVVDFLGVFLDDFFQHEDWEDYFQKWESEKFKDLDLHYRITRENVILSLKAEALLNQ
jgi:hypothetical protein